jgi:high-affinity K+ transport system ATPase subunit B
MGSLHGLRQADGSFEEMPATALRKGDVIRAEKGDISPGTGQWPLRTGRAEWLSCNTRL